MLDGKVGIVTGGSRGLGLQLVDTLRAAGAQIACFARASAELDAMAARQDDRLAAIACDIGDNAAVENAVAAAVQRFGRLDFIINNAAIFHPFKLEDATPSQVLQHVAVNFLGPLWCIRAAIPHLRASQGQILSISSESVRMPFPFLSVYAATKGGMEVLSAAMRDELREDGIRVTVLRSGSIAGSTGGRDWDPVIAKNFFETIQRTGHAAFTGDFASAQSMAKAVLSVLTLPSDVNVDFLEVRAAKPAQDDSIARSRQAR